MNEQLEHTPDTVKVALLGAGTVGSQVARILLDDAKLFTERIGAPMELVGIAVRDVNATRDVELPSELFSTDAQGLIEQADIVIELMGGIQPALDYVSSALKAGKSVVTGNKALLAEHGPELYELADVSGAHLSFEAAVAGAIPIVRPIQDSLSGDRITRILGIMNGTTNYMLDSMHFTGADYQEVFEEAGRLGYLEADPSLDVDGHDSAAKAAILASMAFHTQLRKSDVHTEGIAEITAEDISSAKADGYVIKLLAVAELLESGSATSTETLTEPGVSVRVHPVLVPEQHPLAGVHGGFNAIFVEAENAGELMFYGPGAGGAPTASAVMGDVVSAAWRRVSGGPAITELTPRRLEVLDKGAARSRFSIRVKATDKSGVLAQIAEIFASNQVSIETIRQSIQDGSHASVGIVTHVVQESKLAQTVRELAKLDVVDAVESVLRVEGN